MEWSDNRMESHVERIDARFVRAEGEIKELRREMRAGFSRTEEEIKNVRGEVHDNRAAVWRLTSRLLLIAVWAGLIGLIATLIIGIAVMATGA